mgnify:CR=1 FL=1
MKNYRTFSLIAIPAVIGFWTVIWAINTVFDGPVTPVPAAAELAGSITSQPAEPADWQSVLDTADFQASTDDTTLLEVDTDESIAEPIDSADAEELIFTSAGGSTRQITAEELAAMTATTRSSSVQSRSSAGPTAAGGESSSGSSASSGLSSGLSGGGSSGGSGGGSGTPISQMTSPDLSDSDSDSVFPDPVDNRTSEDEEMTQTDYPLPDWIKQEGIRAGFMSSTDNIPRYVNTAKAIGLNSAIVYGCSFAESTNHLKSYAEWLQLCNQAELHVFAYYSWQPPVDNVCRPVVFADGTEGLFPCPLDEELWLNYLTMDMAVKLAKLSTESPQLSFDGFFLDLEMYGTENQPNGKKNYSLDTCFCDVCFNTFIYNQTQLKSLPAVRRDRRREWLDQNGYLSNYYQYLSDRVQAKATRLRESIHTHNPKLLLGVYPRLNDSNWVLSSVMRAFGESSYPVISFTTDTYGYYTRPWGADRIPNDIEVYFDKYNINGIYVAGYLFRAYRSSEIKDHLIKSLQRADGYWLFRMPQLLEDDISEFEALAGGTQAEYLQSIEEANMYH